MTMQSGSFSLGSSGPSALAVDTSTFYDVFFPTPFPEGSNVIVIPMVQTFNGPDTPGLRIANVTTTGFQIRMNELVRGGPREALSDGGHYAEQIGWIAIAD
ncbi:MAG: hypothetical protein F6K47_25855 [Symploca sp. SIO2E6]|nr:hypothetical protein [Symploca sp. SIO2E6]